jgi:hypothetical protein
MKNFLYILSFSLLIFSCQKEIVEIPESNEPVFSAKGTIGDETINFAVGDNNSIYSYESNLFHGIKFFSGKLINDSTEIELGVYNGRNDLAVFDLNSFLANGSLGFAQIPFDPVFEMKKEYFENNSNIKEIKWYIDGVYSGTNNLAIYEPGKYDICAKIFYTNQGYTELCNEVIVAFKKESHFELKYDLNENNLLSAWIATENSTIQSVNWFADGVLVSSEILLNMQMTPGLHKIEAQIIFNSGVQRSRTIVLDGSNLGRSIEDFAKFENQNSMFWDYKVKLNIKQKNDEYTSINLVNDSSKIYIESVNFLGKDANSVPVYVFKGQVKSKVQSKSTNEILDVNLFVSWAFGLE